MPESINSLGELMEEAATMTSLVARMVSMAPLRVTSTPVARVPSMMILRANAVTSVQVSRLSAGRR